MFEGISIGELTPPVLLGLAILMIMLGWIVPKTTLNDKKREAEQWRLAYFSEREARATSDAQTVQLLELAKTQLDIIDATFGDNERPRKNGGAHVAVPSK
jgi:hypothetical protein